MQPRSARVCFGRVLSRILWPRMSHKWQAVRGSVEVAFWRKYSARNLWGLALSSINTGLVKRGWTLNLGITVVSRMSVCYFCLARVFCTVTRSSLQSSHTYTQVNIQPPPKGTASWMTSVLLPWNRHTAIHHMDKKPAFIRRLKFFPGPNI